jgi:hypothetical protein
MESYHVKAKVEREQSNLPNAPAVLENPVPKVSLGIAWIEVNKVEKAENHS